LEEERRLFYVALTRARKQLTLTHANTRFKNGSLNFCEISRFVDEIQPEFLDIQPLKNSFENLPKWHVSNEHFSSKPNFKPIQKAAAASTVFTPKATEKETLKKSYLTEDEIYVGLEVIHDKFGHGEVMALENQDGNTKATVAFTNFGTKILLLSFAKLRKG
jgi:DNA helicase-2/ATP-dependent DNA helicase PcrA